MSNGYNAKVRLSLRVDDDIKTELQRKADEAGVTMSEYVQMLVAGLVPQEESEPEPEPLELVNALTGEKYDYDKQDETVRPEDHVIKINATFPDEGDEYTEAPESYEEAVAFARRTAMYPEQADAWLKLTLPVGNSIRTAGGVFSMDLWPVWVGHLPEIRKAFAPLEPGFALITSEPVGRDSTGPSTRLVPYFACDVNVYAEVVDVAQAYAALETFTGVPVPLMVDVVRYCVEPEYRQVCDLYHKYFVHYYWRGEPLDLNPVVEDDY